jgi:hypothetical protein
MSVLWLPSDNKFVTEIDIRIAEYQEKLHQLEIEHAKTRTRMDIEKYRATELTKLLKVLKSADIPIISLREYGRVRQEAVETIRAIAVYQDLAKKTTENIGFLHRELTKLIAMRERVKFKLLPFRGKK